MHAPQETDFVVHASSACIAKGSSGPANSVKVVRGPLVVRYNNADSYAPNSLQRARRCLTPGKTDSADHRLRSCNGPCTFTWVMHVYVLRFRNTHLQVKRYSGKDFMMWPPETPLCT